MPADGSSTTSPSNTPSLSKYGEERLAEGEKIQHVNTALGNMYSKENPEGYVNLAAAENSVIWEDLRDLFEDRFSLRQVDFSYGDNLQGSIRLREALSSLFNTHFNPHVPVCPSNLLTGNGLLSLIGQLGRALIDAPTGALLLAAPYYHGFTVSLTVQHGIKVLGVPIPHPAMFTQDELGYLERALIEAKERGVNVQAVLVCNPQNPYGQPYTKEILEAYCQFSEKHNVHLISDEIYALSVFESTDIPKPVGFTSILSLNLASLNVNPERVHMIYGMSKDFNSNGLRAGVLHTINKPLIQTLTATCIFMLVASPSAALWFSLLDDKEALEGFIEKNRKALKESYEHMAGWFKFHGVKYIPSSAGHFVMVDFRRFLSDPAFVEALELPIHVVSASDNDNSLNGISGHPDGDDTSPTEPATPTIPDTILRARETALATRLFTAHRVMLTQGTSFEMYEGGWFRFTFSLPRDAVDVALRRIERALGWERWDGLATGSG